MDLDYQNNIQERFKSELDNMNDNTALTIRHSDHDQVSFTVRGASSGPQEEQLLNVASRYSETKSRLASMKSRLESMRQMPTIEEELADSVEVRRRREASHEVDDDQLRIQTFVSEDRELQQSQMTARNQRAEGALHT